MFLMVTGFMNYGHQTILAARYIGQGFMITLSHANRLPVTIQYPYEKLITSERFCGRIHFEFDECIACEVCVRVCPINLPIVVLISEFVYFVVTALSIVQQFFYQFLSLQNYYFRNF
ncbi:hypothetical protein E1A91_A11G193800v1 [Gossypium mustelinum]|uniref:4Fe-4S ferredoxin-type domain-containing protein n=1 Tax=Gossypium mustelinum TaxID=34275 RepID=A0A5D2X811_GOSMU|nr:hypothetical protein E1A91_A11G193800v1 [Gossypium mustelinum]